MVKCNSSRTPVDTESKLGDDGDRISDPTLYRSFAGSLQYLTFTRPDTSYARQQICLYMHDPREPHFLALKRILMYVCGTLDYGLQLFSSSTTSLVAYSDADWTGCPTTRRSTSGYYVFLGNNLLSWTLRVNRHFLVLVQFSSSTTSLVAYSDADLTGCPTTRRSTSGYCVFLGNNLLSWSSKRQPTLSRSSAEAEYHSVVNPVG
nr:ribonuclease H-like domain-containing protein [Tanacetum cinerariifolium]